MTDPKPDLRDTDRGRTVNRYRNTTPLLLVDLISIITWHNPLFDRISVQSIKFTVEVSESRALDFM